MIKSLWMPPLDTKIRLLTDVSIPAHILTKGYDNPIPVSLDKDLHPHAWPGYATMPNGPWDDTKRAEYALWVAEQSEGVVFPAGTVFVFDRYHVSHSGSEEITLRILFSPDPLLSPKKQGGKLKGTGRVYFTTADLNTFNDVEIVP